MTVDMEGFAAEMEGQKRRSREVRLVARGAGGKRLELITVQMSWLANSGIVVTNNLPKYSWEVEVDAVVRVIFTPDGFVKDGNATKEEIYWFDFGKVILLRQGQWSGVQPWHHPLRGRGRARHQQHSDLRWIGPPLRGGIWRRHLSQDLEGSKFEGRTTILESLVANNMPMLDKEAGLLRKDLDANKLSTALKSEQGMDQICPKEGH